RCSHSGTPGSTTFFSAAGRPALRKYFCARISVATCDQPCGTRALFISKTTEPSGLRIIDVRSSQVIASKGFWPGGVKRPFRDRPGFVDGVIWHLVLLKLALGLVVAVIHTTIPCSCQALDRKDFLAYFG